MEFSVDASDNANDDSRTDVSVVNLAFCDKHRSDDLGRGSRHYEHYQD
jgi:hypothetical protein